MERGTQEFSGSVGDVAGRDVVNHAAPIANSNVVNVQFGQTETVVELVTDHQKAVMMELIDQIATTTDSDRLKIIRVVLARAGAKRIKEIRRDTYVDIERYLTSWLKRVSATPVPADNREAAIAKADSLLQGYEGQIRELASRLEAAHALTITLRRNMRIIMGSLAVVLVCGSVLGYKSWESRGQSCTYAGAAYAVGSVIDHAEAPDIECIAGADGALPRWQQIAAPRKK
ncbi:hypothetical protein ACQUJO_07775 [Ralstonia pseudosolanacearum]